MSGSTDFELLDGWHAGDLRAGRMLFERYFGALYRFFRSKTHGAAADLVQQTLLACVEGCPRFRRDASFRTYLYRTARYQLYAHYRKSGTERASRDDHPSVAASASSPSQVLSRKQDRRLLLEALRRLPIDHQIVLELSFFEELSGREMAGVLGLPEAAVRSRLWRATEKLRNEVAALSTDRVRETADDLPRWAERVQRALVAN